MRDARGSDAHLHPSSYLESDFCSFLASDSEIHLSLHSIPYTSMMNDELSKLREELDRLREQYSSVHREKEQLHAELDHVKVLSEKDAAARRDEVRTLKDIIAAHLMGEVTTSGTTNINDDHIRALKVEVAELSAKCTTLLDENTELRAALDSSETSRESLISSHEQELAEILVQKASIEADKQRAVHLLDLEKRDSEERAEESRSAAFALENAKAETTRLRHELLLLKQASEGTIDQLRSDSDAKLHLVSTERDELRERVASLEETVLCQAPLLSAKNTSTDDDGGDIVETRERLTLLQRQYSQLEHHVHLLESEKGNVEAENKRLVHACDACRLDNELLSKQKETLANQCSLADKRTKMHANDIAKLKAEMEKIESERGTNNDRVIELEERYESMEEDKGLLTMKLERVEKDLSSAQKRQASGKKALEKEIQRASLYRQKALEAHERSQQAKEALACLSLNVSENGE